ncbi:MAG: energy transducer TonB [Planctomycetota bacterium]
MSTRVRQPASGAARSFFTSTAVHAAVLGAGCVFGLKTALEASELETEPRVAQVVAIEPTPIFPDEPEPEEPLETELPDEFEPDVELVPVDFDPEPVVFRESHLSELPDADPALDAFEPVSWELVPPAPEPEPEPIVEPAPVAPPPVQAAPVVLVERMPPIKRDGSDPDYPRMSARRGEEGVVVCLLHVDTAGRVTRVEVEESSGFSRLDDAAVERLRTWRFQPGTLGGEPVAATYRHRVRFQLGG